MPLLNFFVIDEFTGTEHGPYTTEQMGSQIYNKKLKKNVLVRRSDQKDFYKAGDLLAKFYKAVEQQKSEEKQQKLEEKNKAKKDKELQKNQKSFETQQVKQQAKQQAKQQVKQQVKQQNIQDENTVVGLLKENNAWLKKIYQVLIVFQFVFVVVPVIAWVLYNMFAS